FRQWRVAKFPPKLFGRHTQKDTSLTNYVSGHQCGCTIEIPGSIGGGTLSQGLDQLKHIVVLMMENRSFEHMLGDLKREDPRINGLTGAETNPDTTGEPVKVRASAAFQGQLDPDPDHHFPAVHKQLYYGTAGPPGAQPAMQGFIQSYWD